MLNKYPNTLLILLICFVVFSCARPPVEEPPERKPEFSMKKAEAPVDLNDDLELSQLSSALKSNIRRLRNVRTERLEFGPSVIPKEQYIRSLEVLAEKIDNTDDESEIYSFIKERFDFYKSQGRDDWGEVFITSYFEPVIPGARRQTSKFAQPLYSPPKNLVQINIGSFVETFERLSPLREHVEAGNRLLYGRLVETGWGSGLSLVPYYSREEIDGAGILRGQNLELAWVDPVDAFFLQIQGSGTVKFSDGRELRVGYASQNGHPYRSIGRFLTDVIPEDKMSMQAIVQYLRSISDTEMRNVLYKNPSYIFFTKLDGRPLTSFGTEVVEGRTIATDASYYPKGALGYMEFDRPVFDNEDSLEPSEWVPVSRFVLDQDTGGAIKGPHRVDLFWGRGDEAGRHAGVMKNWGTLYYLVPNEAFLKELESRGFSTPM